MNSEQQIILEQRERPHIDRRMRAERLLYYGAWLGALLIGLALLWVGLLRGENIQVAWFKIEGVPVVQDIGMGIVIGVSFSTLLWLFGQRYSGFIEIRERLVKTLDLAHFRGWHIVSLSLVAAVPEEVFFRGAVQPIFGVWLTALIFGSLHALTPVYFVYATVAGLGLGVMAEWHESLWLPIAAHFAVDWVSLYIMARWAKQNQVEMWHEVADRRDSEPFG